MSRARDIADGKFSGAVVAASADFTGTVEAADLSDGTTTVGTEYVTNGSAKAWVNFDQQTPVVTSSFNVSSVTDDSEGKHTISFSSSFDATDYTTAVYFRRNSDADGGGGYYGSNSSDTKTVSAMKFKAIYIDVNDQNLTDYAELCTHFIGDLA
jgi:hypothetical protein